MGETVIVTNYRERFTVLAGALRAELNSSIGWEDSLEGAKSRTSSMVPDLMVIDEEVAGVSNLEIARHIVRKNAMINMAVVSSLAPEAFHEASEGLGIVAQLPPIPGKDDISALIRAMQRIAPFERPVQRPVAVTNVAIIRCEKNERKCPMTNCLRCLREAKQGFSIYKACILVGVFTCHCPGDCVVDLAKILKAKGAEAVHLCTCTFAKKTPEGWVAKDGGFCEEIDALVEKISAEAGIPCLKGTAHLPRDHRFETGLSPGPVASDEPR